MEALLRRTGRLTWLAQTSRAVGLVVAGILLAGLLAVGIDAALALNPQALIAADALLVAIFLGACVHVTWVSYRNRYDPRRLSRLVERRLDIPDSRLINAVDLRGAPAGGFSDELRAAAVAEGSSLASSLCDQGGPSRVADWRSSARGWAAGGAVLAAVVLAYVAIPDLFRAVLPRFLHPNADLPAFTLIQFDVTVEPQTVHFGRPATIRARLSGPNLPDQANVVFLDGPERQQAPMIRGDDLPTRPAGSPVPGARSQGQAGGSFLLQIERADRSREFYISTPAGRSRKCRLVVHPVPQFEKVTVRYEYPPYTRWPANNQVLDVRAGPAERHIRAIEGTRATVTVQSGLPLGRGEIILMSADRTVDSPAPPEGASRPAGPAEGARTVELKPASPGATTAAGSFPLTCLPDGRAFSGRFQVRLWGADGTPGDAPLEGLVTCSPDAMPQVQITEPAMEVVAPEDWKIPVKITAADDVAVERIVLHPGVNGLGSGEMNLPMQSVQPTYATAAHEFDLAALGARGGDVITYFASAADNCPGAAHFTDTPVFVIRVVSKEDYLAYARAQYAIEKILAEVQDFLNKIKEIEELRAELLKEFEQLEKKVAEQEGKWTPADLKKLDDLDARYEQYARKEKELAGQLFRRAGQPKIYEFEQALADMLRQLGDKLYDRGSAAERLRGVLSGIRSRNAIESEGRRYAGLAAEQLKQDAPVQGKSSQQITQAQADLNRIARANQLVAQAERITAITRQQRELADRLGQFRNKEVLSPTEQIRARRLAEEQEQLRKDLLETVELLDRLGKESRGDLPKMSAGAAKIVGGIAELDVAGDQQDAARLAQAGQGRYAHRSADSAAQKLESLHKECGGSAGAVAEGSEDLDGALMLRKEVLAQSLRELAEGRGIPGMQAGMGGAGGEGGGYYGSRAQMELLGPHGGGGDSDARSGRTGATARGQRRPGQLGRPEDAESLNPAAATTRPSGAGAMPAVPVKYRDLTEAYFRRLADESK